MANTGHRPSGSVSQSQNHKAQLANAYNELGKELSSQKIRVVGNYTLGKVIGEGTYGKVRLGVHRLTGTRVAIKQIPKAMSASLTREIHHHRQLHHPHVTQLYEVIATESNIWLVTELCSGGELFDYLAEKGRLTENETRVIFGQLCLAVAYVHEKGIIHRDLKLENVLLDERCRVKLGDFGFTREFERGALLETFCGTTGYASPEMLLAKRYLGPEVDIWSLGVILYTLLTGTLPFDDDDEGIMKEKVIQGEFEDPDWLSDDCRDLIRKILQTDPTKRLSIAQILAHPWFTISSPIPAHPSTSQTSLVRASRPTSPILEHSPLSPNEEPPSASSTTSESTFHSASSEFTPSAPTTPEDVSTIDPFYGAEPAELASAQRNSSEATIRKTPLHTLDLNKTSSRHPEVVPEESSTVEHPPPIETIPSRKSFSRTPSQSSKAPPALPTRTPVRTKRRSVSSTLSDPASPTFDKATPGIPPQDYSSLLNTPAPIIFSTVLERDLLNSLSTLGFDTGQIVHSVLSDACDATGSLWWMMKRKAEKRALEEGPVTPAVGVPEVHEEAVEETPKRSERSKSRRSKNSKSSTVGKASRDLRPSDLPDLMQARSAPELQFIPATPTVPSTVRSPTPPRADTPPNPLLSPSPSNADPALRSTPSTPGGSLKDKDGSKGRKARSGSVSIMQRATTALEAAGLVRKKSADAVREDKDKDKEKSLEKRVGSGEEGRASHGSGSSKLAKTPPLRAVKDSAVPSTPPTSTELSHSLQGQVGSPWVIANPQQSPPSSRAESPRDTLSALPNITAAGNKIHGHRNRGSLLSTFRMWFKEDAKGKRKEEAVPSAVLTTSPNTSPISPRPRPSVRRGSSRGKVTTGRKTGSRVKRASMSSRRSSSVNSRRSSITSNHYGVIDSPPHGEPFPHVARQRSDASRRSFGSHTPISDREEFVSRPSSTLSFTAQQRHRKSPSASSAGSMHPGRTSSPLPRYHRRAGSGGSTRVVRQIQTTQSMSKPSHLRSNSTSSVHSLASSRPGSLYEFSESESRRNSSPIKTHSRHSLDETPRRNLTTFVAHKRQTPFSNPNNSSGYLNSIGRSSWKKSWGMEPPGWQSRSAYPAIEVLAISPPDVPLGIRDVFSGRQSLNLGDESDWVDEDDDEEPGYAGGLGQMTTPATTSSSHATHTSSFMPPEPLTISSHARNAPSARASSSKRTTGNGGLTAGSMSSGRASRGRAGHSPGGRSSPLPESSFDPADARGGRRQLPAGRSGPAFRLPIQEEDEGEEEE